MKHLDDGSLRRMVDEPFSLADTLRSHYETCSRCKERFASIADDAVFAAGKLTSQPHAVNAGAALAAVRARAQRPPAEHARWSRRVRDAGIRRPLSGLVAALVVASAIIWTPAGSLAQNFINVFQPQQVAPLQISLSDFESLQGLAKYGTVSSPPSVSSQHAQNAAQASQLSGITVLAPASLPAEVSAAPSYEVLSKESASFTFSAAKATAAAAAAGKTIPPMPAGIDGSTLNVTGGPVVLTLYRAAGKGSIPQLIIGEMKSPTITTSGVSAAELETYILSLPNVSPQLAAEIRALGDPTSTLPIPIPSSGASSHAVTVDGVQGVAIADSSGLGSGVVWEKSGTVYGLAGPLSPDQVLAVANSLQ
ncbi:MAG: hypothetical protein ACRDFX_11805 [Chloroflexota bacterium]